MRPAIHPLAVEPASADVDPERLAALYERVERCLHEDGLPSAQLALARRGKLVAARSWAEFEEGTVPDGICLDAEGAVWVALPLASEVVRIREGGEVTRRIPIRGLAAACMLGGPERRTLFICAADTHPPDASEPTRDGRIECIEVEVPGAGLP